MEACSKVLAVLGPDDAHDLFTKTFNPSSDLAAKSRIRLPILFAEMTNRGSPGGTHSDTFRRLVG